MKKSPKEAYYILQKEESTPEGGNERQEEQRRGAWNSRELTRRAKIKLCLCVLVYKTRLYIVHTRIIHVSCAEHVNVYEGAERTRGIMNP